MSSSVLLLLTAALAAPPDVGAPAPTATVGPAVAPAPPGAPPPGTAEECGLQDGEVPDYTLQDVSPGSPTYGQDIARGDFPGKVKVLYFALPTCGHCQGQVKQIQAIWDEHSAEWADHLDLHIIALAAGESGLPDLTEGLTLPVLHDTAEAGVQDAYGAEKWYFYLIDRDGRVRWIHYKLDLNGDRDRLLGEIATLIAEEAG